MPSGLRGSRGGSSGGAGLVVASGDAERQRRAGMSDGGGTGRELAANGFDLEHEWGIFWS
jgi:hypothetical protein